MFEEADLDSTRTEPVANSAVVDDSHRSTRVMNSPTRQKPGEFTPERTDPIAPTNTADGSVPPAPEMVELVDLAEQRRRLDAREVELLAGLERSGATVPHSGHKTSGWLADATSLPIGKARHRVRTAIRLRTHHRDIADALTNGTLTWEHAAAWCRVANPRNRDLLNTSADKFIELAALASFEKWLIELNGIAAMLDQDGNHNPLGDDPANRMSMHNVGDVLRVAGEFHGEVAAIIRARLDAATDEAMRQATRDFEATGDETVEISRGQARARALVEQLERAAAVDLNTTRAPEPDLVIVHDTTTGETRTDDGHRVPPSMMRWLITAAVIRTLEVDGTRDALRMGKAIRFLNRDQRRALVVRDGGCVFPGCTAPATWCDGHHVDHYNPNPNSPDGSTDIENLALLCRHHHRLTHRPRWTMRRHANPTMPDAVLFQWTTPYGNTITSQRHHTRIDAALPTGPKRPGATVGPPTGTRPSAGSPNQTGLTTTRTKPPPEAPAA